MDKRSQIKWLYLLPICLGSVIAISTLAFDYATRDSTWQHFFDRNMGPYERGLVTAQGYNLTGYAAVRVWPWFKSWLMPTTDVESLNINVKFKDWQSIRAERDRYLGKWVDLDSEYRNASINWRGDSLRAKIRLKGMGADHRAHDYKWSFAIKMRGAGSILGMDSFAIHDPKARRFQSECLYGEMLRAAGVLATRCGLVRVAINGEDIGVMLFTERVGANLLEHQGRKAGVVFESYEPEFDFRRDIVRYSNSLPPPNRKNFRNQVNLSSVNKLIAPIHFYDQKKLSSTPPLASQARLASSLYEQMVTGKVAPSEVVDVPLVAKAIVITFLWGDRHFHPFHYHNLRWYFNPLTGLIEPFPTDINVLGAISGGDPPKMGGPHYDVLKMLLNDPVIYDAMMRELGYVQAQLAREEWPYLANFDDRQTELLAGMRAEYPFLPEVQLASFKARIDKHYDALREKRFFAAPSKMFSNVHAYPSDFQFEKIVRARYELDGDGLQLLVLNAVAAPVQVSRVVIHSRDESGTPLASEFTVGKPLAPTLGGMSPEGRRYAGELTFTLPLNVPAKAIERVEVIAGAEWSDRDYSAEALEYPVTDIANPTAPHSLTAIREGIPWALIDEAAEIITFPRGDWAIGAFWVLPRGFSLKIEAGSKIDFSQEAGLLVLGRADLAGSEKEPIILKPEIESAHWRGIAVLNANESDQGRRSRVRHTIIADTNFTHFGLWALTGAVTFYNSDVLISDTVFLNTVAEDALNIVHSRFSLNNVEMTGTRSDAFDADFTTGNVSDSRFAGVGGDAVDVSGSRIDLDNVRFDGVVDKAVSVGEASQLVADRLFVSNSATAVVSKDGSRATVRDITLRGIDFDHLMVYVKKPTYGTATLTASNLDLGDAEPLFTVQSGNTLLVDGGRIDGEKLDVDALYDGRMKK